MPTHRLIAALIPLALAACTVGPDYHEPKSNADVSFQQRGPGAEFLNTSSAIPLPAAWWTALNDTSLNALVAQAADANLDVQQAEARIREARAQRAVVFGRELPALDGGAGYDRTRLSQNAAPYNAFSVPGFPWEFNSYQAGFDATWELDIFGGNRRALEAAGAEFQAAVEDRRAVLVSLQGEVARTYVELRGAQRQRTLAQANLDSQTQTLSLTRDRVKNGVGSELDVSRAAALAAATEAAIPLYDRAEWEALHRLATLTREPLYALLYLLEAKPIPTPPQAVSADIPANLVRRRPDIRRAERQLAAASARVGVAEADLYPKLSLTGVFNLQSASIDDLVAWRSRSFSIGPTVTWPIFEAGRLRAVVVIKSAQQEEALLSYERTVDHAIQEVRDQLVTFSTELSRHASLQAAVKANEDSVHLADQLYRQGLTDFLTVLDAQRQLYQQQDALAKSDAQLTESFIALQKALGGGWAVEMTNDK